MSLLSKDKRFGRLSTGSHDVRISNFKEVENEKGGYLEVTFVKENKQEEKGIFFPTQINSLISNLREAMGIDGSIGLTDYEVLEKGKKTPFKLEIRYNSVVKDTGTGEVRNYRNLYIGGYRGNDLPKDDENELPI